METLKAFYLVANFFGVLAASQPAVTGYDSRAACVAAGDQALVAWSDYIRRNPALIVRLHQGWEPATTEASYMVRFGEEDARPAASWLIGSPGMLVGHLICIPRAALTPGLRKALESSP
jgi:hypothetical protein